MFKRLLFWNISLLILFASFTGVSCTNKSSNDLYMLKALKTSLVESNAETQRDSEFIFNSFKAKTELPETMDKALLLFPEMTRIRAITSSIIQEIENAQSDLRDEARFKDETEAFYREDDFDAVERLFVKQKKATHLFRKMREYKLMLIDSAGSNKDFVHNVLKDIPLNESGLRDLDNFIEYFKNQPAISADAFLEQLKGNVLRNEKKLLSFISNRITNHLQHSFPDVVVTQNATALRQGDVLKIKAGIGSFRYYTKSSMVAEGFVLSPDEKGIFNYSIRLKVNPGKYKMPITLTYIEADGNPQTFTTTVEYEIIK